MRRLRRVLGLVLEEDEELEHEAEAGALLEAETANEIRGLHEMVSSYIEALNNTRHRS